MVTVRKRDKNADSGVLFNKYSVTFKKYQSFQNLFKKDKKYLTKGLNNPLNSIRSFFLNLNIIKLVSSYICLLYTSDAADE